MKILFIAGSLNQGGAEFQLLQLAKLFQEHKHDVEVFAITDYNFYRPFIEKNNIAYFHLNNDQGKFKRVLLTAKKIKITQPDLIVSYLKVPSQVAVFAKYISHSRAKLIVGERTSFIQPLYDCFHFNLMHLADHLTVNSVVRLKQLQKHFSFLRNKISFFPNIIDLDAFPYDQKRSQLNSRKIGFVGRIAPEKNIVNLIKAIKLLTDNNNDVQLLLYGDARNEVYLEKVNSLIAKAKLQDSVVLKGKTDTVQEAYKNIDLLCLISDYEGFSNVISEALCSGVPVITSDVEENKYLIENGVNGFVVNHKDPESIAEGIEKYLQMDAQSKDKMSKENRKKAEVLFDKDVLYSKYMAIINELIAE